MNSRLFFFHRFQRNPPQIIQSYMNFMRPPTIHSKETPSRGLVWVKEFPLFIFHFLLVVTVVLSILLPPPHPTPPPLPFLSQILKPELGFLFYFALCFNMNHIVLLLLFTDCLSWLSCSPQPGGKRENPSSSHHQGCSCRHLKEPGVEGWQRLPQHTVPCGGAEWGGMCPAASASLQ